MSRITRSVSGLAWIIAALAGVMALALLSALKLLVYLNRFGAATASSLLFAEAAVNLAASLLPLAVVLRGRSVAVVLAAEAAGATITALAVCAVDSVVSATTDAAIPAWWIALLAASRACTAAGSRLTLDRKAVVGSHALLQVSTMTVSLIIALATGSVAATIAGSMVLQAASLGFALPSVLRRPIDPEHAARPPAWGTWLARVATAAPLPLAILWFGRVAWTAPLAATACVSLPCWLVFAWPLAIEKIARATRMMLALALALGFGLAVRTAAPALYGLLFSSLALHRDWFAAISWAGVLLVVVPLLPSWRLADHQTARAITAVLGIAAIVAGGCLAGMPGLVLGAAVSRALQWRHSKPASEKSSTEQPGPSLE